MSDEVLLNDLCCVCSVNVPKYKCPGCLRQTCSLPCSKRHKTQMNCTGKRDAAAPISRAELATPQGFDRDYNFLVGVERQVEAAKRTIFGAGSVWEKTPAGFGGGRSNNQGGGNGIGTGANAGADSPAGSAFSGRGGGTGMRGGRGGGHGPPLSKKDARLGGATRTRKIDLQRAPTGMKRYLENRSTVTNKSGLIWTVEWFLPDGTRHLSTVSEETTITDAYRSLQNRNGPKKRTSTQERNQLRGRDESVKKQRTELDSSIDVTSQIQTVSISSSQSTSEPQPISTSQPSQPAQPAPSSIQTQNPTPAAEDGYNSDSSDNGPPTEMSSKLPSSTNQTGSSSNQQHIQQQSRSGPPFFFLHQPHRPTRTRDRRKTIIPLLETATLAETLKGKVILEFPTLWVFEGQEVPLGQESELVIIAAIEGEGEGVDAYGCDRDAVKHAKREEGAEKKGGKHGGKPDTQHLSQSSSSGSDVSSDSSSGSDSSDEDASGPDSDPGITSNVEVDDDVITEIPHHPAQTTPTGTDTK